jgi:hypothetical protein
MIMKHGGEWVKHSQPLNTIYRNDVASVLASVGPALVRQPETKLAQFGMDTIQDLVNISEDQ